MQTPNTILKAKVLRFDHAFCDRIAHFRGRFYATKTLAEVLRDLPIPVNGYYKLVRNSEACEVYEVHQDSKVYLEEIAGGDGVKPKQYTKLLLKKPRYSEPLCGILEDGEFLLLWYSDGWTVHHYIPDVLGSETVLSYG